MIILTKYNIITRIAFPLFEEHRQCLQTGLQGEDLSFPSHSSVIPAFSHSFAMGGGGVALSLTACQVVLKDKNHRRSGAGGIRNSS